LVGRLSLILIAFNDVDAGLVSLSIPPYKT